MRWQNDIWTYVTITIITILIWVWAAGETRQQRTLDAVPLSFQTSQPQRWIVSPTTEIVAVTVDGSPLSLQRVQALMRRSVDVEVPEIVGPQTVNLLEALRSNEEIAETGARVLAVDPPVVELDLDVMQTYAARVQPVIPGIEMTGEPSTEPSEALVTMPSQLRAAFPDELVVHAFVPRSDLDDVIVGSITTRQVSLRLPAEMPAGVPVSVSPPNARVTFTLRSVMTDLTARDVPIRLMLPPGASTGITATVSPASLDHVLLSADASLAARIQMEAMPIEAVIRLDAVELQPGVVERVVDYFTTLVPGDAGRSVPVVLQVRDPQDLQRVRVTITRAESP